jgi:hypothetical protein
MNFPEIFQPYHYTPCDHLSARRRMKLKPIKIAIDRIKFLLMDLKGWAHFDKNLL